MQSQNTLICRFFGLHRIKHGSWGKLYLIIMSNIFDTDRVIHTRYDLKGSTVGRKVSEFERNQVCRLACLSKPRCLDLLLRYRSCPRRAHTR